MTPIIPPIWLYWFEVLHSVDVAFLTIVIILAIATVIFAIGYFTFCFIEEEVPRFSKGVNILLIALSIILIISLIGTMFIPSQDTMIYMAALSFVTPDNVSYGTEVVKNVFDYVVDALGIGVEATE